MFVLVSGATGLVGKRLCKALIRQGHQVGVISRSPETAAERIGAKVTARAAASDFAHDKVDAIINLAGAPIFAKRWSEQRKQELIESRVAITESLVDLCGRLEKAPQVMISASAMGYYGDQGERMVEERTPPRREFAHTLCARWEQAAHPVTRYHTRLAIVRLGLVFDPEGGMLPPLLTAVRFLAGARLGNGHQFMPWVALEDVVNALLWLLENEDARGAYNLSAPHPVRNNDLMSILSDVAKRPVLLRMPAWALRLMLGEMARMLLTGADMRPAKLTAEGFRFHYPTLRKALHAFMG